MALILDQVAGNRMRYWRVRSCETNTDRRSTRVRFAAHIDADSRKRIPQDHLREEMVLSENALQMVYMPLAQEWADAAPVAQFAGELEAEQVLALERKRAVALEHAASAGVEPVPPTLTLDEAADCRRRVLNRKAIERAAEMASSAMSTLRAAEREYVRAVYGVLKSVPRFAHARDA